MAPFTWRALEPSLQQLLPAVRDGLRRIVESGAAHQRQQEVRAFSRQFAGELSPLILRLSVASHPEGRRLALELVGRHRSPGAAVQRSARRQLSDRAIPLSARLAATRGLLRAVGRDKRAAYKVLRRFAAGLGHKRIDRLDRCARWLDRPALVARLRSELLGLQRLRCPRCGKSRRRYLMADHLWRKHKLLLDDQHARSAYTALDRLLDQTSPPEALNALHRRILCSGLGDGEARDQLFAEAEKRQVGLCPRCLGFVPVRPGAATPPPASLATSRRPDGVPRGGASCDRAPALSLMFAVAVLVASFFVPSWVTLVLACAWAGLVAWASWQFRRRRPTASPTKLVPVARRETTASAREKLDKALTGKCPLVDVADLAGFIRVLSMAERARFRVVLCEVGFASGLTATELNLLGRAFQPFDQLFSEHAPLIEQLYRLWRLRGERPWRQCGAATTVFELARYPSLAAEALERTDDLLLLHPLPPAGPDDAAAPISLCGRGIQFRGQWIQEPGTVRVIRRREGGFDIRVNELRWRFVADPGRIAGRLKRWIEYWFGEFLAGFGGEQPLTESWVKLLHANAATCPECGGDVVPAPGCMGIAVPKVRGEPG